MYYKRKVIYRLTELGLIKKYSKNRLSGYRLTGKGKKYLLSRNPERFSFYLTGNVDTNNVRTAPERRMRLHRKAETYVVMQQAGAEIFRDRKPPIYQTNPGTGSSPAYYCSREIKECGEEAVKIKGSRAMGVLLVPHCTYAVYNTANTLIRWDSRSERKMKTFLSRALQTRGTKYGQVRALVIGTDIDVSLQILISTGGEKRKYLLVDTDVYDHMHFVPLTAERHLAMYILTDPEFGLELNAGIIAAFQLKEPVLNSFVEHDAITAYGLPVLIACDFDLVRIVRFATGLRLRNRQGIVVCFDFQVEVLTDYFDGIAEVMPIESNTLIERRQKGSKDMD